MRSGQLVMHLVEFITRQDSRSVESIDFHYSLLSRCRDDLVRDWVVLIRMVEDKFCTQTGTQSISQTVSLMRNRNHDDTFCLHE